jgi:hypothetical protein
MKTPARKPADSAPNVMPPPNGLNHDSDGWMASAPAWPEYTLTSAVTAKIARISSSRLSRMTWVRADSSMPIQAISVISRIHTQPTKVTQKVLAARSSAPKSWKV